MKDQPEPRPDGAEDDGWTRRKKAICEGVIRRVGGGRPTAAERKRQEELYREWIEAGRPGDFLGYAHARRDPPPDMGQRRAPGAPRQRGGAARGRAPRTRP